ncbi:MAG: 50S ribosomal protein L11 methyltransferase [Desulfobacteraceae bacterium]|nr:50S ribosomal protein L11 methyltransferase [Desulfobacteraceae bacterium]
MTGHKEQVFEFIKTSSEKLTISDIAAHFGNQGIGLKIIRLCVKELLNEGVIEYSYELGNSFLTPSFNKFVQISDRIVVYPPNLSPPEERKGLCYIRIENSTSFGRGNHPTTRLCLLAMEKAVKRKSFKKENFFDLGCGTGILALGAAFLGFDSCFAVDIDPVAVFDSKQNVKINNLDDRIIVDTVWPENQKFNLVAANLRPVSLIEFKAELKKRLEKEGALVLSGFKSEEKSWLLKDFGRLFSVEEVFEEKGWCSALLS